MGTGKWQIDNLTIGEIVERYNVEEIMQKLEALKEVRRVMPALVSFDDIKYVNSALVTAKSKEKLKLKIVRKNKDLKNISRSEDDDTKARI